jgi:hypothetical protein
MNQVMISYSKDYGNTWSDWKYRDLGDVGEYRKKVRAGPFGIGESFTFRIRLVSDRLSDLITASAAVETKE